MWSKWAPPLERSRLATTSFCGEQCFCFFLSIFPNWPQHIADTHLFVQFTQPYNSMWHWLVNRCLFFRYGPMFLKSQYYTLNWYHDNLCIKNLLTLSVNEHGSPAYSEGAFPSIHLNEVSCCSLSKSTFMLPVYSKQHCSWICQIIGKTLKTPFLRWLCQWLIVTVFIQLN